MGKYGGLDANQNHLYDWRYNVEQNDSLWDDFSGAHTGFILYQAKWI